MGDAEYEVLMAQIKSLQDQVAGLERDAVLRDRRIHVLERQVVRKDHLLRIFRDSADDELDQENGDVNGESDGQP